MRACTVQVELAVSNSETAARMVKAKIEKTVLGQVAAHIKAVLQPTAGFVSICLDLEAINRLQLIITPRSVALALLKHTKLKLKADMIRYCFVAPPQLTLLPPCVSSMPGGAEHRAQLTLVTRHGLAHSYMQQPQTETSCEIQMNINGK